MTIKNVSEILEYLESHTWKQTAEKFDISEMSIKRLIDRKTKLTILERYGLANILVKKMTNLTKTGFSEMTSAQLRLIHALLTNRNVSMTKRQYIDSITRWCVKNWNGLGH